MGGSRDAVLCAKQEEWLRGKHPALAVIDNLFLHSRSMPEVFPPVSVLLSLSTHVDLGRGDMLADPERMPAISKHILSNLIWMSRSPLRVKSPYLIKHTFANTRSMRNASMSPN